MHPGPVRKPRVHPGPGIVQPPPRHSGEPLREPAHRRRVGEGHPGEFEPAAAVHPHPVGSRHQNIGDSGIREERLQYAGPDQLPAQLICNAQHFGVPE